MVTLHRCSDGKGRSHTYTAEELIAELKKYPGSTPVIGEWDTFGAPIDSIELASPGNFFEESCLVLDVSEFWNMERSHEEFSV